MKYNPQIHHRRSIRLQEYDYSQNGAYFVTLCTQNRECLFGKIVNGEMILNEQGKIVEQCWNDLSNHYNNIVLDAYVIMPNHFHGIIFITDTVDNVDNVGAIHVGAIHELPLYWAIHESPLQQQQRMQQRRKMLLPKIIGRFKMNSAKQINQIRNTSGVPVWQRNYYEQIIRNEKSLEIIRNYIINNPLEWYYDDYNPKKVKYEKQQ
jgi:REP element-mobilizing transposase RayT